MIDTQIHYVHAYQSYDSYFFLSEYGKESYLMRLYAREGAKKMW